jgi:hypothetical protein
MLARYQEYGYRAVDPSYTGIHFLNVRNVEFAVSIPLLRFTYMFFQKRKGLLQFGNSPQYLSIACLLNKYRVTAGISVLSNQSQNIVAFSQC